MNAKKLYIKLYAILLAVVFVIVAAIFVIRYCIMNIPIIEESWGMEILKYFVGYIILAVICGVIAYTPFTFYIQRKVHGLIK